MRLFHDPKLTFVFFVSHLLPCSAPSPDSTSLWGNGFDVASL